MERELDVVGETAKRHEDGVVVDAVERLVPADLLVDIGNGCDDQFVDAFAQGAFPARHLGRALAVWGDGGWGSLVRSGKQDEGRFDDRLVAGAVDLIRLRWRPDPAPSWVTFVPSRRDPVLVADFAERLALSLGLPCEGVVVKVRDTEPQKTMQNSPQQYINIWEAFEVTAPVREGAVLLVDDIVDSRWTLTAVGWKLRAAGVCCVHPFALADTAGRSAT